MTVPAFGDSIPVFSLPLVVLAISTLSAHLPRPKFLSPFVSDEAIPPHLQPGFPTFTLSRASVWKVLLLLLTLLVNITIHTHAILVRLKGKGEGRFGEDEVAIAVYLLEVVYILASLPLPKLPFPLFLGLIVQCFIEVQEGLPGLIISLVLLASLPLQEFIPPPPCSGHAGGEEIPSPKHCAGEDYRTVWGYFFVTWSALLSLLVTLFVCILIDCSTTEFRFSPLVSYASAAGSLSPSDIPPLPGSLRHTALFGAWSTAPSTSNVDRKLIYRILALNRFTIISGVFLRLLSTLVSFASPYFMQKILEELSREEPERVLAFRYAALSLGCGMAKAVVNNRFMEVIRILMVQGHSVMRGEIYRKALKRKDFSCAADEKRKASQGKTINLMAIDSDRAAGIAFFAINRIEAPAFLVIGIVYLYNLLGYSALIGATFAFASAGASKLVMNQYQNLVQISNKVKDQRMTKMNELIHSIRHLKWFAWEDEQAKEVMKVREKELRVAFAMRIWNGTMGAIWGLTMPGVLFISFLGFVKLQGQELTVPVSFTAFVIFNMLEAPVYLLSQGLMQMIMVYASVPRIDAFLRENEVDSDLEKTMQGTVGFKNASFDYEQDGRFKLMDLDVEFKEGLNLVVGLSGSGKTSLLLALLGDRRRAIPPSI
ncbi:hypothetical protein BT69DRAFT_1354368 [Atractiella rhizophila]|nr:hypothetical protein BT69DRAFT_1354368 [Atractiella rhizophila]